MEWQGPGEALDDVAASVGREPVEQLVCERLDARLHLGHPPRGEGAGDEPAADPRVEGRVGVDDDRHLGPRLGEDGLDLRRQRLGRGAQRVDRREALLILEHRQHVVVAGHDPEAEGLGVEDRCLAAGLRQDLERALALLGRERVEVDRAAARVGARAVPRPRLVGRHEKSRPPLTRKFWPVMNSEPCPARKITMPTMSSGTWSRLNARCWAMNAAISGCRPAYSTSWGM